MKARTDTMPWATRPTAPTRFDGHRMVAVYLRISADDEGDRSGVDRQYKLAAAMAAATNEPVTFIVFCDNNKSAGDGGYRPEFQDLVGRWLPSGCIDEIRVYMQKRFWRLLEEGEDVRRVCQRAGIDTIRCVRDGDTSFVGNGRMMARFRSMMDTDYTETIGQLMRDKKRDLAEKGLPHSGGPRPFGYTADRMQTVPAEAKRLREAATRVLAGETVDAIVRDWNQHNVGTSTGASWRPEGLRRLLVSPRNAAISTLNGEVIGEAKWQAVFDRDTFNKLAAALAPKRRGKQGRHLLSGLLVCGRCGGPLTHNARADGRPPLYACKGGQGRPGCGRLNILAAPTEALLVDALLGRTDKAKTKAAKTIAKNGAAVMDVDALQMRKRELSLMFANGKISGEQLMAGTEAIDAELGHTEATATKAAAAAVLVPYLTQPGRLRDEWTNDKLDDTAKRAILRAAIESVTVAPSPKGAPPRFNHERIVPGIVWNF